MVSQRRWGSVFSARASPACGGLDAGAFRAGHGGSFHPADQGNQGITAQPTEDKQSEGVSSLPPKHFLWVFVFLLSLSDLLIKEMLSLLSSGNGLIMMKMSFLLHPLQNVPSPSCMLLLSVPGDPSFPAGYSSFCKPSHPPAWILLLSSSLPVSVALHPLSHFCLWRELCYCLTFWFVISASNGFEFKILSCILSIWHLFYWLFFILLKCLFLIWIIQLL